MIPSTAHQKKVHVWGFLILPYLGFTGIDSQHNQQRCVPSTGGAANREIQLKKNRNPGWTGMNFRIVSLFPLNGYLSLCACVWVCISVCSCQEHPKTESHHIITNIRQTTVCIRTRSKKPGRTPKHSAKEEEKNTAPGGDKRTLFVFAICLRFLLVKG